MFNKWVVLMWIFGGMAFIIFTSVALQVIYITNNVGAFKELPFYGWGAFIGQAIAGIANVFAVALCLKEYTNSN